MKKRLFLTLGTILLIGLSWAGCKSSRAGYEGPEYTVLSTSGKVEIRRYADMIGAVTSTAEKGDRNSGFGRLFRYISGENEGGEKIAMTSPVFMEADGEANETAMIFVMPRETVEGGVPDPASEAVAVRKVPGGDFAVLRFKGHNSKESQREALASLRKTVAALGLEEKGEPVFAYYDPPWIPEFLRRNEVLVRVTGFKE